MTTRQRKSSHRTKPAAVSGSETGDFWSAPSSDTNMRERRGRHNREDTKADEVMGVVEVPGLNRAALPPVKKGGWDDLLIRAMWSIVMVGAFVFIIYLGHLAVSALVVVLQSVLFRELSVLRLDREKERKLWYSVILRWYFFFVMMVFGHGRSLRVQLCALLQTATTTHNEVQHIMASHEFFCFCAYSIGIVGFVLTLRKGQLRYQFGMFAWTHMALGLVILQTCWMTANIFSGLIWFVVPAFLVIANDTTAYICGRAFGKTRLIALSPKKTWEGFIGATFCTVVFAVAVSSLMSTSQHLVCPKERFDLLGVDCDIGKLYAFTYRDYTVPAVVARFLPINQVRLLPFQLYSIVLALFASSIGPFGGFFASGIKRALKKKDFGDIIPGHGGLTDRFDCQILMAAFTFYFKNFVMAVPLITSAAHGMALIARLPLEEQIALKDLLLNHLENIAV